MTLLTLLGVFLSVSFFQNADRQDCDGSLMAKARGRPRSGEQMPERTGSSCPGCVVLGSPLRTLGRWEPQHFHPTIAVDLKYSSACGVQGGLRQMLGGVTTFSPPPGPSMGWRQQACAVCVYLLQTPLTPHPSHTVMGPRCPWCPGDLALHSTAGQSPSPPLPGAVQSRLMMIGCLVLA